MNQKLLIVDDNIEILESLSELLMDEGFILRSALSGEEALEILSDFDPAVILSDMNMPGMSGLELLKTIRETDHLTQFVVLTGYATVSNAAESMADNGAFAYLQKPIMDFEILFTTLRQALQKYHLLKENMAWEERLKKANAAFEAILENMDALIYVAEIDTCDMIYANAKLKALASLENDEAYKGKKCWEVLKKSEDERCSFCCNDKLLDQEGKPLSAYTYEFYNPAFQKHFSVKDQAIYWHDGRVVKLQVAMDMTRYKRMTSEIQKAKRFKAIGVLAGGIAHDLNNTLASILGNLNLAQLLLENSDVDDCFKAAEKGIMQAKALSEKLLSISRGEVPVKESVDVKQLIETFIDEGEYKGICRLEVLESADGCSVFADVDQLNTVLYNLVTNAVEAMEGADESDKKVKITLDGHYSTERRCDVVNIKIHDTGKGIPQKDLDKIFDPYYSTKFHGAERGTGLGLTIAYSIVKKHGGYIEVDSVEGEGTRVDISIPVEGSGCERHDD